jgi:hypothetical protein
MFEGCRLGVKKPDPKRIAAHVKLTPDDIDASISRVPFDWHQGIRWDHPDLGNRDLNLCGPAAVVEWCNLMARVAGLNVPMYGRPEAERIYRRMGWDGTFASDDGVVLLDLMCQWMQEPFCGVMLDGFFVIGHGEDDHVATANTLSPLIAAASLTKACQTTDLWDGVAADDRWRFWGNHAFLYFADSPGGGTCVSWCKPVRQTDDFRRSSWIEAYLPVCRALQPHLDLERFTQIGRLL